MGFVATDIANVPTEGYDWYIMLLEDGWNDDLRDTLSDNFENLAERVGSDALVVKGLDWETFYPRGFDRNVVETDSPSARPPLPAFLITNRPPNEVDWTKASGLATPIPKVLFLPLSEYDQSAARLGDFLETLAQTLQNPESIEALQMGHDGPIEEHWAWLDRYLTLNPNFLGFGVDVNEIISDLIEEGDP
ncbi:hypothetical protein [Haloarchaeobius iranensis]|uniref:Uncharacterized protein n=1 Tax=Haloarchaeobius iranensis TaxID=996166 RepID=A0A1G9Y0V7_9EURY|nr:hypothetical protein [Haloarchaeobius iranensis]SDN02670.1 hypothetical protein SAMN05192554_11292 [Haloarchaeobius iranensis]